MNNKIAIIADTHWGVRNDSPIFLDYFKRSVDEFFLPFLERNNIKTIIHLGDLVDRRKYININTARRLRKDFLEPINEMGVDMHIIAGNHDEYYKDTYEVNILSELASVNNHGIYWYNIPHELYIENEPILLLPWITNDNNDASMNAIYQSKAKLCMAHLHLNGFEMYRGHTCTDATHSHLLFENYEHVLTGHFHTRSQKGNISYIGAFTEHNWADYNDPRGFSTFDMQTRELEFHRNPFSMYHMFNYDDSKDTTIPDFTNCRNSIVKVNVLNKDNPYMFDMYMDALMKEEPFDASVVESSLIIDEKFDEELDQKQDTGSLISTYIDGLTLPVEKDKIKHYLHEIYHEAIAVEGIE